MTEEGFEHAGRLASRLKGELIKVIYTSSLLRAVETAKVLNERINVPVKKRDDLMEIRLGEWEGKTPEEINGLYDNGFKRWKDEAAHVTIPGAEELAAFRKRAESAFMEIVKESSDENVAIVTHGGIIASVISFVLDIGSSRLLLRLDLVNTGVTLVKQNAGKLSLVYINDHSHCK